MAWLQKRGGVWWMGYRLEGRQFRSSTGCKTKEEAEKVLAKHEAMEAARKAGALTEEYFHVVTGKAVERPTLETYLKRWLREAEPNVTKPTQTKYRQVVREFSESVRQTAPGILLQDLTADHVSAFLVAKRAKSCASTVSGFRRILSSICIQARDRGLLRGNPVATIKPPGRKQAQAGERRPFTLEEVRDLYSKANGFWKFMIVAGFFSGQSLGDLVTLKRANVDLKENVLRLTRRKTGKRVTVPLALPLKNQFISNWPKLDDEYFWPEDAKRYLVTGSSPFSQEFYELLAEVGLVTAREDKQAGKNGRSAKRQSSGLGFHNLRHMQVSATHLAQLIPVCCRFVAFAIAGSLSEMQFMMRRERFPQKSPLLTRLTRQDVSILLPASSMKISLSQFLDAASSFMSCHPWKRRGLVLNSNWRCCTLASSVSNPHQYPAGLELKLHEFKSELILRAKGEVP